MSIEPSLMPFFTSASSLPATGAGLRDLHRQPAEAR
jgi:hypothetical protein